MASPRLYDVTIQVNAKIFLAPFVVIGAISVLWLVGAAAEWVADR